ncbi:MAG: hypothetical protein HN350_03060 [Phycisphaerales bacterium]|jgi:hypothetical protein|nr:hypothetical protein [Phycisphaerales bacterium]
MKKSTLSMALVLMFAMSLPIGCGKGEPGDAGDPGDKTGKTATGTGANATAILDCIPAGSTFYVTKSLSDTIDSIEMFLIDISVGERMGIGVKRPGDGIARDSMLLAQLKGLLRLGDGLDATGSAAMVLVNPEAAGINIVELLKAAKTRAAAESGMANPYIDYFTESKITELLAIILPGNINAIMVGKTTTEGPLTVITSGFQKIYAVQKGSHVVMSPSKTAVTAVLNSKKSVTGELSADQIAMVKGSELTIHLDLKPYKPMLEMLLNLPDENLYKRLDKAIVPVMKMYISMGRGLLGELDATTIGLKLGSDGVNIDSICTAKPGSTTAKIFQAESSIDGGAKVLDSVPSLPYVSATGMTGWMDNPLFQKAMMDMSMSMMGAGGMYKIDEKTQAQMLKMQDELKDMVTGVQLVIGGAPKGKGVASLAYVIKCKDSAKYRSTSPQGIELYNKMMASTEMPPGSIKFAMDYAKDAEKIGDLPVDVITMTILNKPEDDQPPLRELLQILRGEQPELLKMILGEEKIRMRVAAPDATTLVMTVGGTSEAMAQTLKTLGGKGPISSDPGTVKIMKFMPKNPSLLALFNTGNLMDVIRTGMTAAGAKPDDLKNLPAFNCKTPIAFGMKAKGETLHTALHVPKPVIKEAVTAVLKLLEDMQRSAAEWNREINGSNSKAGPGDF